MFRIEAVPRWVRWSRVFLLASTSRGRACVATPGNYSQRQALRHIQVQHFNIYQVSTQNFDCRISKLKSSDENLNVTASFMSLGAQRKNAMVGISVEPLVNIQGQTPAAQTEAVKVSTFMEFGQKMVENLFNFASSFAVSGGEMRSRSAETFVPFSCLQQWYNNFERRLQHDPNFWRK